MRRPTVVVVGAGVSGLAAAWELLQRNEIDVAVLDAGPTPGGKLRSGHIAGQVVDVGAESMLARRPEALDLLAEAGLDGRVTHPRPVPAAVLGRGRLWPLPPGTVMGVPTDPATAAGLLTPDEVARAEAERTGPPVETDVSVGDFVEQRVGSAVVDRLVEPLLAGVYAGHARRLSLQATVPALWAAAASGSPIVGAPAPADRGGGPVFAGYRGGLGGLATDLARVLTERGVRLRTGTTVRSLERQPHGWRLTTGPTTTPETVDADGVLLAVPAAPAARLLAEVAPAAAGPLGDLDYASVAIVTLAVPRTDLLSGSGFLVPPVEPLTIKAATFSAAKWAWVDDLDPDLVVLRASLGRFGETAVLQREDADLVRLATEDLRRVLGSGFPEPVDAQVQRWGGALPQYAVGHLDRIQAVFDAVARQPALGVAGAAYEGVGIPACVASGRRAARSVAAQVLRRE